MRTKINYRSLFLLSVTMFLVSTSVAFGVDAVATTVAPASPMLARLKAFLQSLGGFQVPLIVVSGLTGVIEISRRMFKTEKPASLLYDFRDACVLLARFLDNLAQTSSTILQNSSTQDNPPAPVRVDAQAQAASPAPTQPQS